MCSPACVSKGDNIREHEGTNHRFASIVGPSTRPSVHRDLLATEEAGLIHGGSLTEDIISRHSFTFVFTLPTYAGGIFSSQRASRDAVTFLWHSLQVVGAFIPCAVVPTWQVLHFA
jgi:hypothetical protein